MFADTIHFSALIDKLKQPSPPEFVARLYSGGLEHERYSMKPTPGGGLSRPPSYQPLRRWAQNIFDNHPLSQDFVYERSYADADGSNFIERNLLALTHTLGYSAALWFEFKVRRGYHSIYMIALPGLPDDASDGDWRKQGVVGVSSRQEAMRELVHFKLAYAGNDRDFFP